MKKIERRKNKGKKQKERRKEELERKKGNDLYGLCLENSFFMINK